MISNLLTTLLAQTAPDVNNIVETTAPETTQGIVETFQEFIKLNTNKDFLTALIIFAVCIAVIYVFKTFILIRLKAIAEKTNTSLDDFIVGTFHDRLMPIIYVGVLYGSIYQLEIPSRLSKWVNVIMLIVVTFLTVRLMLASIFYVLERYAVRRGGEAIKAPLKGLEAAIKLAVWGIALIVLMDNLGIEITALATGLGIGGIAIALAAKEVLGDLFSYVTIFFDRPFEVGDFIIIGDFKGSVEHIGIKTTRLRSVSGEQLIMGNSDLTSSRIRNYKRMEKRRGDMAFGVTYDTPTTLLEEIPEIVKTLIESEADTEFARAHFSGFGDSSLNFAIVYYILVSDYGRYMDIQQSINLKLMDIFKEKGIDFAFPTRTIHMIKD